MPLLPTIPTQDLEDHFFGSGAFSFGWFETSSKNFPAIVKHYTGVGPSGLGSRLETKIISEQNFIDGIKWYAQTLPDRTYQDLLEDMDAADVDAAIQFAFFDEIRYS